MRKGKDTDFAKVSALVVGVAVLAIAVAGRFCLFDVRYAAGIGAGSSVAARMCHPLFHAGVAHAMVNVYVLWQLVFFFPLRMRHLLLAYAVACLCPWQCAVWPEYGAHALGLSGVVYGLMGWVMPETRHRSRFNVVVAVWMVLGMLTGQMAVGLHLWCYAVCAIMSFFFGRFALIHLHR